jgi:hypothetical protein
MHSITVSKSVKGNIKFHYFPFQKIAKISFSSLHNDYLHLDEGIYYQMWMFACLKDLNSHTSSSIPTGRITSAGWVLEEGSDKKRSLGGCAVGQHLTHLKPIMAKKASNMDGDWGWKNGNSCKIIHKHIRACTRVHTHIHTHTQVSFFFFTQFKTPPLGFKAWHLKCGFNSKVTAMNKLIMELLQQFTFQQFQRMKICSSWFKTALNIGDLYLIYFSHGLP